MAADSSPRSDLRANLLLVAGSTLVALLILAAIEGALRLTGVGEPAASRTSQLKYQQLVLPSLVEGERGDGTRVWAPADGRVPYQWIRREKPEDGLRVFAFGGSATAGLGYSPNVAYPRILARMLEAAYPGRPIEVMNLGIVALSSTQVRVLVQDVCERYAPDILIVYSGNNEFLEIHARRYFEKHASTLTRSLDFARRSNLFRLIDRAVRGTPQNPSLADQDLSRDTLRLTQRQIIQDIELAAVDT